MSKTNVKPVVKKLYSMFRGDRYAYGAGNQKYATDKPLSWWLKKPQANYNKESDYVLVNTFYYLCEKLDLDNICNKFNKKFNNVEEYDAENLYGTSLEAETWLTEIMGFKINDTFNTYNYETLLDETLQFTYLTLEIGDNKTYEEKKYILLQVHKGGDVRGNYTDAQLFCFKSRDIDEAGINSTPTVFGTMKISDTDVTVSTGYDGTNLRIDEEYSGMSENTKVNDILKNLSDKEKNKVKFFLDVDTKF